MNLNIRIITEIFSPVKIDNLIRKKNDIFNIFLHQTLIVRYTLELPWQGSSYEYPQSNLCFGQKNKIVYPCTGLRGYILQGWKFS